MIENRLHGSDGAEASLDLVEKIAFEHAGITSGGVHVVFENIPAGEDEIVEAGERNEFFDLW